MRQQWKISIHLIGAISSMPFPSRTCPALPFSILAVTVAAFTPVAQDASVYAGVGIDIASASISDANNLAGDYPVSYFVGSDPTQLDAAFDLAFSYEVIYLLQDLSEHARQMKAALRENGVYYAVTGCHTESPLWNRRRDVIATRSNTRVPSYSPDDYINAFADCGFKVTLRRFGFTDFAPPPGDRKFHPGIMDALTYNAEEKILFRFAK